MKLRCPRCQSKIAVPDGWAGRSIRCKGCNKSFRIPRPSQTIAPVKMDAGLNLEDLASLERGTHAMDEREAKEYSGQLPIPETSAPEPAARTCPHCKKEVTLKDPYVEALCSSCWQPIPALVRATSGEAGFSGFARPKAEIGFYSGLTSAFGYPFGASGSLLASVVAAVGVILLPVAGAVGVAFAVEQGKTGLANQAPLYFSGVQKAFVGFVLLEVLFFLAVGVHAFLDVVRTTAIGTDRPPELVWNPSQWGSSIVAYVALLAYYALFALVALWLSNRGEFHFPTTMAELRGRLTPGVLLVAAVFTFVVPMHLIGIATSSIIRGLNPVNVGKSIAATHVNYVFVFLLVAVYAVMFGLAFSGVVGWFAGVLERTSVAAGAGNVVQAAFGLLSWGAVIGFGFYGIYFLGRLHGLFARTFRKQLAFFD